MNYLFTASFSDVSGVAPYGKPKPAIFPPVAPIAGDESKSESSQGLNSRTTSQEQPTERKVADKQMQTGERPARFNDYTRPRPSLSPADEATLFAEDASNEQDANLSFSFTQAASGYTAFSQSAKQPDTERQSLNNLAKRKQSYVAQLYAQIGDITFSSDNIVNQAA
jgi:hypothetical protein